VDTAAAPHIVCTARQRPQKKYVAQVLPDICPPKTAIADGCTSIASQSVENQ